MEDIHIVCSIWIQQLQLYKMCFYELEDIKVLCFLKLKKNPRKYQRWELWLYLPVLLTRHNKYMA